MPAGEEEVVFKSGAGRVYATLRGGSGRGRRPFAVLAHGFGSFRDELTGFIELADRLAGAGIASLRLDMRGCGKSGERGRMHPMWDWVDDVRSAVSFGETLPTVAADRIGVIGMSMGGGIATIAAAIDRRLKAVVALAPVADGEDWFRHLWRISKGERHWQAFVKQLVEDRQRALKRRSRMIDVLDAMAYQPEDRAAYLKMARTYPAFLRRLSLSSVDSAMMVKAVPFAPLIAPRALLVVHSRADGSVPVRQGEALHAAAGAPRRLILLDHSPHCFWIAADSERVQQHSVDWLKRHL